MMIVNICGDSMKRLISFLLCLSVIFALCACGNSNDTDRRHNSDDKEEQVELSITEKRSKLLEELNGVVKVDVPTFKSYFATIYSPCYIVGEIVEVDYDDDDDTYTYRIRDEEYFVYIWVEDYEEEFKKGDVIYIVGSMEDKSTLKCSKGSISTEKDDLDYMSVNEYKEILEKVESLYFKVSGYVFVETEISFGKTLYYYYLYASEDDYGKENAQRISLGFDNTPENVMGKELQIMGQHRPDADVYVPTLIHCSIVE